MVREHPIINHSYQQPTRTCPPVYVVYIDHTEWDPKVRPLFFGNNLMSAVSDSAARIRIKVAGEEVIEKCIPDNLLGTRRRSDSDDAFVYDSCIDGKITFPGKDCSVASPLYPVIQVPSDRSVPSLESEIGPVCVFCGFDDRVKFGQGDLRRFHTSEEFVQPPTWYKDVLKSTLAKQASSQSLQLTRSQSARRNQRSHIVTIVPPPLSVSFCDKLVGPYTTLDGCRRLREHKNNGSDGKPCLPGLPNAYFDCEGRPFGLVDELSHIGWPTPPKGEEALQLCHLISRCSPREGGEGSWIFAHHCCASWSTGVHFSEQVSTLFFNERTNRRSLLLVCFEFSPDSVIFCWRVTSGQLPFLPRFNL
ncbi:hypothetical protein P879_05285 [Paragonimus westermani]|uniref:Uncharacterized protein n=1 Tax=Paragonimus westermani TaxID=34504 RepID=A0A8T0DWN8_9TREM|nr:hypothetical protein P879_05285 [Paragonimus westermani]